MEIILKKTTKSGNASAVVLPKSWLDKKVRIELVEKTTETILSDVLDIIKSDIELSDIIGIYLVGSHARKEQTDNSDIDILVISEKTSRELIKESNYEILIVSLNLLKYKLKENLLPIGTMLKEAKPLLNNNFLKGIKIKVTKENVKWYINTTEDKLNLIEGMFKKMKNKNKGVNNRIVYTLILRIRTLYMIKNLIENEDYSNKKFIKLIKSIFHGTNAYESYLDVKNNNKNMHKTSVEETEKLYDYLKKQLVEVKRMVKN